MYDWHGVPWSGSNVLWSDRIYFSPNISSFEVILARTLESGEVYTQRSPGKEVRIEIMWCVNVIGVPASRNFKPALGVHLLAIAAMILAPIGIAGLQAQAIPTDYEVKAAYLYNFGGFVQWPAKTNVLKDDLFDICVLGQDPFGQVLDAALAGESIAGKKVAVRRVLKPQDAIPCRIIFVSSSESSQLQQTLAALDNTCALTVSDLPQFSQHGGMIQFILEGKRVRFDVNLAAVEHAGLTLSSELLKVAVHVRRDAQRGD